MNSIFWHIFLLISIQAGFSTVLVNWNQAFRNLSQLGYFLAIIWALITLFAVLKYNCVLANFTQRLTIITTRISKIHWIIICIITGIAVRIIWSLVFPPQFRSDYAEYFNLARNLLEYGSYSHNHGYAYWPPGYPLFLYLHFLIFGVHSWVPLIANLWLFSLSIIVTFLLSRLVSLNNCVSYYSSIFLVFWPTYVASVTLPSKEMILVSLLPTSILLNILSTRIAVEKHSLLVTLLVIFFVGILSGVMSLAQPSMLLFLIVLLFYQWSYCKNLKSFFVKLIMMIIGTCLVISPWDIRNYGVLNEFVLISTNGGDVFYRANNPIATGVYLRAGERDLEQFGEVERSKVGYRWGIEWILGNPVNFLKLALQKQIFFLGDDGKGIYETLKRGLGITDIRYFIFMGVSNLYYLIVWIFVLSSIWYHRKSNFPKASEMVTFILTFLYLFLIHSIFESGGKHHESLVVILAIFAALMGCENSSRSNSSV